ncbi:MAG: hypothetical protein E7371_05075 [Clostridiales bacterium]|nr:hypothetical protein [Clostridiales bacterium]
MARISKKVLSYILGAVACLAMVFGILTARPQTKTASAETAVTFNKAHLGDEKHDVYGTSIRFDTVGATWATYHNWLSSDEAVSMADYTTVNGRTVTEINNATTSTQKVTLMLQPAGSFSFFRVYIPEEVMSISDIKSMGILDGWSFNTGVDTFTSSAVTFFRSGNSMIEESAYTADTTELTASNISISDATLTNYINPGCTVDSYYVDIDLGMRVVGEFEAMYDAGKFARQAIYINGRSIEEWNKQKLAEDERFGNPASYMKFPQNSTDPSHLSTFVKPVGLWCTDTGFRVSIYREFVVGAETVTVSIGEGCYYAGKFMVMDTVSKTVLTQSVVDITEKLTFLDNSKHNPASWGETKQYYIHTNNEACWTKSPLGGCLNESDPFAGGQIQMKYIYFNGTSLYDINKSDDGVYGSTHDNIKNGSIYAPIFVNMSTELGSSLKLTIPTNFTNGKAGHEEIIIKKGFSIVENGVSYYVSKDIIFTNNNGTWTKEIKAIEIPTEVTGIITKANRTDGGNNENFVIFQLSQNDYAGLSTTAIADISSLYGYINIDGNVVNAKPSEPFFNVWGIKNSIAFRAPGLSAAQLQEVKYITIKAGAKFPAYTTQNGGDRTYYVTKEDVTFVHDVPNDTWTVGEAPSEEPEMKEVDITSEIRFAHQNQQAAGTETYLIATANNYWTKAPKGGCLNEYDQEQMSYIYFNGTSLRDINKNDDGSYGSEQPNIKNGGIYAPILVAMGTDGGKYSYIQLHIPTAYTNGKAGHEEITIKAGFSVTEDNATYVITKDMTWVNLNGSWVNMDNTYAPEAVTIGNVRTGGTANELYMVDITSDLWSITCNNYDFMYGNAYAEYRKHIFINGVSVYDINENTDDSAYVYSTFPMKGADDATFAKPIMIETFTNNGENPTNKMTIWIHKDYMKTLDGEVVVTLGAGYSAYANGKALLANVDYSMTATVTIDGISQTVIKGECAIAPSTDKPMTETTIYEFIGWFVAGTELAFDFSTPIMEDVVVESRYKELAVGLRETQIKTIDYYVAPSNANDRWLLFYLTEHDYPMDVVLGDLLPYYDTFVSWGTFDKIILKGQMTVGGVAKTEATLQEIFNANGRGEAIYLSIWNDRYNGSIAVRAIGVSLINEIVIEAGCFFPSYAALSGELTGDVRYAVMKPQVFTSETGTGIMTTATYDYDISMADGASVRIKDIPADFTGTPNGTLADETSGIRFETRITVADLEKLLEKLNSGEYQSVRFGTLIVSTSDLMGGQFNHQWLDANGVHYKDIECTAGFYNLGGEWTYAFPDGGADYQSYFGSLVKLKTENYTRWFSGLGYIKIVDKDGDVIYTYAEYDSANSRSIAHVAQSAICDRSETQTSVYKYKISDNSYSPYTAGVNNFLNAYVAAYKQTMTDMGVAATQLDTLKTPVADTVNPTAQATITVNKKLAGAYVVLQYSTNVNIRGKFYYQNTAGTKTAVEDFYLQAGTTEHTQFLDIYRYNGVGYGLTSDDLYMTKIELSNVEFTPAVNGNVKLLGFYSMDREIPVGAQEIYLTVAQDDGSEMTVGAHLGLGGALTYLAKSGVYEGLTGSVFSRKVALKETTGDFSDYYGSATSSKPSDNAVNLINNFDAGRQIQQSWYAAVGGTSTATANENGYTRAFCKTESNAGKYWPYNPVQAGDVVSNPSQIIDYEINETQGYIYIKARAMDWAKGQKSSDKLANTINGGSTTKSYMENYYRLNADGTLYVNNAYVDWNGFTDMEKADWASTELPAVYPIQSLNYYVSNLDGNGTWADGLEYNSGLGSWTKEKERCIQLTTPQPSNGYNNTKVEEWFAWANGGDDNAFALGVYIPNVDRFTSGRSTTSTNQYSSGNNNSSSNILKEKGLMSNMQSIIKSYQGAYVGNTSYTAPGINFRMEAYKSIDYTYVIALNDVKTVRATFKAIKDNETVTNAGQAGKYEKVGLDAWARADKQWTW